jgi:hypothetical protein
MNTHADRERRTARLVRACYAHYVAPGKVTAEQLYALCKLTWITKGGAKLDDGLPDNTRTVIAPALMVLTGASITATAMPELPDQLKEAKAPPDIVRLVAKPLGFVNFYTAFRKVARVWIAAHVRDVTRMVKLVASASSDPEAREAYAMLDQLPPLPRRSGGGMPAVALISPMLACLDPRSRSPIINSRAEVRERLQLLGLRHATVGEQFDGFVNLIGQAGIRDAFDLDTSNMNVVAAALKVKPRSRAAPRRASPTPSGATRNLDERDDADVEFFRRAGSVKMRRLHHTMTNALRRFCKGHGLAVEEGSAPEYMFDALIRQHDGDRHLLVEVKTDSEQPTCRLAVGQLLDYRRQLKDRARTDLGVLFPEKPSSRAKALLEDVGVKSLWFTGGMKAVKGLGAP